MLALLLTLLLQIGARALHPPAASMAMLRATGTVALTLHHVLATAGAVAVVGLIGEPIRRWEAKRIPRRRRKPRQVNADRSRTTEHSPGLTTVVPQTDQQSA